MTSAPTPLIVIAVVVFLVLLIWHSAGSWGTPEPSGKPDARVGAPTPENPPTVPPGPLEEVVPIEASFREIEHWVSKHAGFVFRDWDDLEELNRKRVAWGMRPYAGPYAPFVPLTEEADFWTIRDWATQHGIAFAKWSDLDTLNVHRMAMGERRYVRREGKVTWRV